MQAALCSLDHCALWRSRRLVRISRQTGADQCDRRSAAAASVIVADCRAAVEQSSALRKHLARHEQPRLMQRAAICCEPMRLSGEPRSSYLSLPARHLSYGKARPPIQEFLARMIELRRTAILIAAHAFRRARFASHSRGNIEIIHVDGPAEDLVRVRRGVPDATRPATECDEQLPPARYLVEGACAREGLDAAPNACVDLPFLLADEMCKDATYISDCMH